VNDFVCEWDPCTFTEFKVSVYDMTAPPTRPEDRLKAAERARARGNRHHIYDHSKSNLKTIKTIHGTDGSWTMTDTHLSPDNQRYALCYDMYCVSHIHVL